MSEGPLQRMETAALANLAAEINAEHRAFVSSLRKTAEHGIRAGELLREAKTRCKHGTWLVWLENNFEGAPRTAQVYMQLYEKRDELRANAQSSAHLSISGALKEIAAPQEEKPEAEREELTDERVAEVVRDYMGTRGPTDLTDVERAAMERRLEAPGKAERDLLRDIHHEYVVFLGAMVSQHGFFLDEREGKDVVEYRSPDKKRLFRVETPVTDESLFPLIRRGCRVYGVFSFRVQRLMERWFTRMLIAELGDLDQVERRVTHNADWRQSDLASEYVRDKLLHEGFDEERELDWKKWALRHEVADLQDFRNAVYTMEKSIVPLWGLSLERLVMGPDRGSVRR